MGTVCVLMLGVTALIVAGLVVLGLGAALGAIAAVRALRRGRGGPA